jgi:hypothetical protein
MWTLSCQTNKKLNALLFLCRLEEAIKLLEYVVQVKEDKLGTVHPDVHDDRERLQELLKDVGRTYTPKTRRLEELLITARKENRKRWLLLSFKFIALNFQLV